MKAFTEHDKRECDVEVYLNRRELKELLNALIKFESTIAHCKKGEKNLGSTDLRFKDCEQISKNSKADIIFHVKNKRR